MGGWDKGDTFFIRSRRRPKKSLGISSRRAKRKGVWGKEFLPACRSEAPPPCGGTAGN